MSSTNHIKIGVSNKLSLSKGNLTVGVKGTTEYGPTSQSGFYNGITPPVGGYTLYVEKDSQGGLFESSFFFSLFLFIFTNVNKANCGFPQENTSHLKKL